MKYININQKLNFKFCQVPRKILYTEPYKSILCPLSQLAYIFILDRLNLSRMNNKVDEYGNIYLFMTRKEMGENLKASSKTVIKIFKELEEAKLIKQENQGKGKAYKIYVIDIYSKDMENLHIGNEKSVNKVVEFLPSNNINKKVIEIIAILIGRVYMQLILNNTKKDLNNYLNRVNITQRWEVR